jgi:hypothetical protein
MNSCSLGAAADQFSISSSNTAPAPYTGSIARAGPASVTLPDFSSSMVVPRTTEMGAKASSEADGYCPALQSG